LPVTDPRGGGFPFHRLAAVTGLIDRWPLPDVLRIAHLLAVLAALVVNVWLLRGGRPRPWAFVYAGTALTFWILTGASAPLTRGA